MTASEIRAIRERAEKASPAPWRRELVPTTIGSCHKIGPFPSNMRDRLTHLCLYVDGSPRTAVAEELAANADFIAHAREDVPALLAEVERLRKALEAASSSLGWIANAPTEQERWDLKAYARSRFLVAHEVLCPSDDSRGMP